MDRQEPNLTRRLHQSGAHNRRALRDSSTHFSFAHCPQFIGENFRDVEWPSPWGPLPETMGREPVQRRRPGVPSLTSARMTPDLPRSRSPHWSYRGVEV